MSFLSQPLNSVNDPNNFSQRVVTCDVLAWITQPFQEQVFEERGKCIPGLLASTTVRVVLFWFHFHFLVMLCHSMKMLRNKSPLSFAVTLEPKPALHHWSLRNNFWRIIHSITAKGIVGFIWDLRNPKNPYLFFSWWELEQIDLTFSSLTVKISTATSC